MMGTLSYFSAELQLLMVDARKIEQHSINYYSSFLKATTAFPVTDTYIYIFITTNENLPSCSFQNEIRKKVISRKSLRFLAFLHITVLFGSYFFKKHIANLISTTFFYISDRINYHFCILRESLQYLNCKVILFLIDLCTKEFLLTSYLCSFFFIL